MNLKIKDKQLITQSAYPALRGIAYTAAVFSLILSILLIANYFQTRAIDPINSRALQALMEKLKETPGDMTLKNEIRALDLLARKAYFTSRWQLQTGSLMLLGFLAVMLISFKTMVNIRKKLPMPEGCADANDSWLTAIKARKWIVAGGTFLLGTALVTAALTHSDMGKYDFIKESAAPNKNEFLENWSNFRGPGGNGIAQTKNAPVFWDGESGKGIQWKAETPLPGYSSPVIWENRLFLTGADKTTREVYCFDRETGNIMWQKQAADIPGSPSRAPGVHGDTGYAAPTTATNGRFVYAIFANGDLICFDMNGNKIWAQNLGIPDNHYGHSSSLMTFENLLIVQYDQNSNSKLLALEAATGETVWRVNRSVISWSSPIIVNTGTRMELILTNSTSIDSYHPLTGVKIWGLDCMGGEMGPSACYANGMVFGANDYAVVAGIRIGESGAELLWEYDENLPDTASPLATDKYLFFACSYGYFVCLNAKTGELIWEQEFDDGFYSSPILVDDRIYAMDLQGVMHIFEAADQYNSIADCALGEPSACTPAFVDGRLYIRGEKYIYCIEGD